MKSCRVPVGVASGQQWSAGDPLRGLSARQLSSSLVARRHEGGGVTKEKFRLNIGTINPSLLEMEYAVRGPLLKRAMEIQEELKQVRLSSFVFDEFGSPGARASTSVQTK